MSMIYTMIRRAIRRILPKSIYLSYKSSTLSKPILKNKAGFSMLELMIAIAIIAILAAVSAVSYRAYLIKTRRAEAQTGLLYLIAQAEQYALQNNIYPANSGPLTVPVSQYYKFTAAPCGNDCFRATATAIGSQLDGDSDCSPLTLDTTGARSPNKDECWNR